ncbi:MAG: P1 family peptidase [Eubacteriales bacterium]|nr:P1 family peptidase [Eubacteriales bacterium]
MYNTPSPLVREIPITEMEGLRIGNASDNQAKTGVTVLLFDHGARAGVDISGGGPASRETPLASPYTADNPLNAIVFSGGSAFGLAAGDGVTAYLEERGIGYETGAAKVPLVCQSCIYDLGLGRADVRPDRAMGYAACKDAEDWGKRKPDTVSLCGSIGAGTGASVGKICGMDRASKSGTGIYAVSAGDLKMAAVVVLNALGDIYDPQTGAQISGLRTADGSGLADSRTELYRLFSPSELFTGKAVLPNANTTIGAVVTNGKFSKAELGRLASMTRCAYARCINPVGTMADGDSIYAVSVGEVPADINMAGTLAAEVMCGAIRRAVSCAG